MKNLKKVRKIRGLTQKDLADKLNFNEMTISNYENNKTEPDITTIINLCSILKVSADYLLGIETQDRLDFDLLEIEKEVEALLDKIKKLRK